MATKTIKKIKNIKDLNFAIVVTTYKRNELLDTLLDSIKNLNYLPAKTFIIDNDKSKDCEKLCDSYSKYFEIEYVPMKENTGGAGGFSHGTDLAHKQGYEWLWLMDDDVAVLEDSIEKIFPWTNDYKFIQPSKYNFDGSDFYWQYNFLVKLGIPNPIASAPFDSSGFKFMNTCCFEGAFFNRDIVNRIGIPDARFFIYWDDTIYGYLATKFTKGILIEDKCLRRTRDIKNMKIGSERKLNSTSDMVRYYIFRNRGYMAKYFKQYGDYNPFLFHFGTFLTFCKELIRITITGNIKTMWHSIGECFRGMKDAKKIFYKETHK
ncbi:MAG: glycosyltransferase [Bifidobacteriaceae bacterium]|jgi:glycosyltransferase involved in cell wall biosynthesis|nr:glycosyltransferase [Bifidobacteriaceae bacterium]